MGAYVNPPMNEYESKEEFLDKNGSKIIDTPLEYERVAALALGMMPVCLVHNGAFTAAAIAYSASGLKEFSDPKDRRPRRWFLVEIEKLLPVSNLSDYYKGDAK